VKSVVKEVVEGREAAKGIDGEEMGERRLVDDSSGEVVSARVLCAQSVGCFVGQLAFAQDLYSLGCSGTSTIILEPSEVPVHR
jgi:hypothetical protein